MEPGTLELQIFVSLIVILGTAFVALVCDYLKGNNESLREHNIELRVRKEEQEKHQPLEAVQWLQHLLGATQRNPIRFGSVRPATRREAHPAARHAAHPVAAASVTRTPAAHSPVVAQPTQPVAPVVQKAVEVQPKEVISAAAPPAVEVAEEQRASRLHASRARRQAEGARTAPSLLDTLPKPAWLQKEQEEKAAARAMRERDEQDPKPAVAEAAPVAETRASVPPPAPAASEPRRHDPFWTYRGLLDRVVAATSGPGSVEEPAVEAARQELVVEKIEIIESSHFTPVPAATAYSAPIETISTVAIDVPAQPEIESVPEAESSSTQFVWTPSEPLSAAARQGESIVEPDRTVEVVEAVSEALSDVEDEPLTRSEHPVTLTISPEPKPVPQLVSMPSLPELRLPPGYHDRSVFTRHMHSTDVLTGVVAAIGINDYTHHSEKMGIGPMAELMRSVETMIAGMLRANVDFGCRSNDDEFILVFPNETGADAQRRLTTISERLWNFQLRSLTSFSVFFSWGAVEVQGETLPDAAASASERMYQTKRNRKTLSVDGQRRKLAVNL
jgi:GGDEF domain-containing protein